MLCFATVTRVVVLFIPVPFQPCISPYLIHSIHAKLFDITWQWCLSDYHQSPYRIRIPVNIFYFRKINAEPAGNPVFNPRGLFLCLNTKVGQISDLCINPGWNIWIRECSFIYQTRNCLWILTVIFAQIIVIQFFGFFDMMWIHMYRFHSLFLQVRSKIQPVVACWFHSWNHKLHPMFLCYIIHPALK